MKIDTSAFDEPENEVVPTIDTSAFDEVSQVSQPEQTEEQQVEVSGIPIVEPTIGYASGRAAQELISKTGEWAERGLEKVAGIGGTSPEQLKLIKKNFPGFKDTDPIAEMNRLLDRARGTNVGINQMYEEAAELLADKKITPDEFNNLVELAALEKNKYGQFTFARPISESEVRKTLAPALESTQEIVESKQEKLLKEFADLKAKEAVAKASEGSLNLLPKEAATQIAEATREQVLQSPETFDFRGMQSSEILPIYQEQRGKLISEKETARDLTEMFPSLKGTSMDPREQAAFRKIIKSRGSSDISGNRLQEILREYRDAGWTEQGQLSEKPAASMSKEIRKEISRLSPEAGKLMEAENIEIDKLKELEKAGYIKRVGKGTSTTIEMPDAQINRIVEDLTQAYEGEKPTRVLENLDVLQKYLPENQLKKLELAAVKLAEKKSGDIDYVSFRPLNAILQGLKLRKVSRGIATAPEALTYALPKTSMVTNLAGKGIYKALPVLGAGIGGVVAQAAEEATSPESSGATPQMSEYWEGLGIRNPAEQKARAELSAFREEFGTQPKTIQQQYPANLALEGMVDIAELPEITQQRELLEKRKQDVLKYNQEVEQVKKAGALAPTYVEKPMKQVLKSDNPAEIASFAQALQSSSDRASQEYGRVLSQVANATPRERDSLLFGLNQQPAFRQLIRSLKGDTEEELP